MSKSRLIVPIVLLLLALLAGTALALLGPIRIEQMLKDPLAEKAGEPVKAEAGTPSLDKGRQGNPSDPTELARALGGAGEAPPASEPSFDVARINPEGASVFAGRAEPFATVTVLVDGHPVGTARADENGEWSLVTEETIPAGDPILGLKAIPGIAGAAAVAMAEAQGQRADAPRVAPPGKAGEEVPPSASASAAQVTSRLLERLEGLVASAQKDKDEAASRKSADAAAASTSNDSQAAPAPEPRSDKAGEPELAASAPKVQVPEEPSGRPTTLAAASPSGASSAQPSPPASIPVPIRFVYREAQFTEEGRKAVKLLLEYVKLKDFPSISLSGHADERGSPVFNLELSRERLEAVASYLKDGGYEGKLVLVPKGETEPFPGVDRSKYDAATLFQLDRRVELHIVP